MADGGQITECRVHGDASRPTVLYLPGLHGDWTLVGAFRSALGDRVRFVEFAYPRSVTAGLPGLAAGVLRSAESAGIRHGWLLAESFGSQVAWALLDILACDPAGFQADGLILAGGFVRFPWPGLIRPVRSMLARMPESALDLLLRAFAGWVRFCNRESPGSLAMTEEFLTRRREPGEREAMVHRLELIRDHDPRPRARAFRGPVWSVTGGWDPVVPWPLVHRWLKRDCPGWRGAEVFWNADHTVLVSQPGRAAQVVGRWMGLRE